MVETVSFFRGNEQPLLPLPTTGLVTAVFQLVSGLTRPIACKIAACAIMTMSQQALADMIILADDPPARKVTVRTGKTKPTQIINAVPRDIVQTSACGGARIKAPAKIAASQNTAIMTAAIFRQPGRPNPMYRSQTIPIARPASVAATIGTMLRRI